MGCREPGFCEEEGAGVEEDAAWRNRGISSRRGKTKPTGETRLYVLSFSKNLTSLASRSRSIAPDSPLSKVAAGSFTFTSLPVPAYMMALRS